MLWWNFWIATNLGKYISWFLHMIRWEKSIGDRAWYLESTKNPVTSGGPHQTHIQKCSERPLSLALFNIVILTCRLQTKKRKANSLGGLQRRIQIELHSEVSPIAEKNLAFSLTCSVYPSLSHRDFHYKPEYLGSEVITISGRSQGAVPIHSCEMRPTISMKTKRVGECSQWEESTCSLPTYSSSRS